MDNKTPWPIELNKHPGFKKETINVSNSFEEIIDPEKNKETVSKCFEQPRVYRESILNNVHIEPQGKFTGKNVFYMWLNKTCPVGCDFCFFQSPKGLKKTKENEITDEGINKIIKFASEAKLDKFVVSGGGEPMVSLEKVLKIVSDVESNIITVVTSGFWAKNTENVSKILEKLHNNAQKNKKAENVTIRLSLDAGHLEKLSKENNLQYVKNIIDWFSSHTDKDSKFKFLIHTMDGDNTVEKLISELDVKNRNDHGDYLKKQTSIELNNGLKFTIEYSQVFDSNVKADLHDQKRMNDNLKIFEDFIKYRRNGNMSIQFHDDKPKGVYFLTLYDGTNMIWGATSPDNESSIYEDDYKNMMEKNYNDVLSLAILEKGSCYIQNIVSEVNPIAVYRSVVMGIRDFYSRLLLEEDSTRLYSSIRVIQEYIKEGRLKNSDIEKFPAKIKTLIFSDIDTLKEACRQSPSTILSQYLEDKNLNNEKLIALYEFINLGHYNMTPEKMVKTVLDSNIDNSIKNQFMEEIKKSKSDYSKYDKDTILQEQLN